MLACEFCARLAPMQPPGNHQVKDQPKITFKPERNSLSQMPQLHDLLPMNAGERWRDGAQKKGTGNSHPVQGLANYTAIERFNINGNVWQLGQIRKTGFGRNSQASQFWLYLIPAADGFGWGPTTQSNLTFTSL